MAYLYHFYFHFANLICGRWVLYFAALHREAVGRLLAGNQRLARENAALMAENKRLTAELAVFTEKLDLLAKTQERLEKQVVHLMKATDEASRKRCLQGWGLWMAG